MLAVPQKCSLEQSRMAHQGSGACHEAREVSCMLALHLRVSLVYLPAFSSLARSSLVYIDNKMVVNNDGENKDKEICSFVTLETKTYDVVVKGVTWRQGLRTSPPLHVRLAELTGVRAVVRVSSRSEADPYLLKSLLGTIVPRELDSTGSLVGSNPC
eukprot:768213-Hanusia_phi.AAC.5